MRCSLLTRSWPSVKIASVSMRYEIDASAAIATTGTFASPG